MIFLPASFGGTVSVLSKHPLVVLVLIAVMVAVFALWFWLSTVPRTFQLAVVNHADSTVDSFYLYGSGVVDAVETGPIISNTTSRIVVSLRKSGELRFLAKSGLNRIDYRIAKDVSAWMPEQKTLTIENDNRFLFSP